MSSAHVPARKASVAFVLVVLLLDTLGIGVIIPVLPKLVASFLHGNLEQSSHSYGAFVAVYSAMQFMFAPVIGGLSDRFGRRVVILGSLGGAALDYLLMAFAPALSWLFVGRVVSGITGASFSAATAYIADVTPPEKRAQSFGMVGAAFGLGFIIGPAVGGVLGDISLRAPFLCAAALNLVNFLYGVFVLPESLPKERRRKFSFARANPLGALRNLGRHPILLGLTGTLVCSYLAQNILQSVWALYTGARYGWNPLQIGLSLTVVGVAAALVQGGLVRVIIKPLGERRALIVGLLFAIAGHLSFGAATHGWLMYVLIFPFALGGIGGPAVQALLSREVSASEQGELQGSLSSLMSVTAIAGPIIGTELFARFGPKDAHPYVPGAPFFAAAALCTIGLLLALRLFSRLPASVSPQETRIDPVV